MGSDLERFIHRNIRFPDDAACQDLLIEHGRIKAIAPCGSLPLDAPVMEEHGGGLVFPLFCDIHTHLDKTLTWDRNPNLDGTFQGAITAVTRDREAHWTPDDVRARMAFALNCAWAHGTGAIRTHLDTIGAHGAAVWPLFREIQQEWSGRITLQASALVMLERYLEGSAHGMARQVAETPGGLLGAVVMHDNVTRERVDTLLDFAETYQCGLDLHVDENGYSERTALEVIAEAMLARRFRLPVLCGHCCSLSQQDGSRQVEIIGKVRDAGIGIVSLPSCNLYLQDRASSRTPFWRGVTLVHELRAAGVPVMFASDNVRDPFFAYGDYDMLEVFSSAVRIAHLDTPFAGWAACVTSIPAAWMGVSGTVAVGQPADLVFTEARNLNELVSRSCAPRRVMRGGTFVTASVPDYRTLDGLLAVKG